MRANRPSIEPQHAANPVADGRRPVRTSGVRTGLRHHAVAIGHQVDGICLVPRDVVLLERFEPVVEDLGVGPERVGGVRALNRVLMQEGDRGLDQLPLLREEKRETGRTRLAKRNRQGLCCKLRQGFRQVCRTRERSLAD
jgi:hypothetical protein